MNVPFSAAHAIAATSRWQNKLIASGRRPSHYAILERISKAPQPIRSLVASLGGKNQPQVIIAQANRMVREGNISRFRYEEQRDGQKMDRRLVFFKITEKGRKALAQAHAELLAEYLDEIGEKELNLYENPIEDRN